MYLYTFLMVDILTCVGEKFTIESIERISTFLGEIVEKYGCSDSGILHKNN
jgi:hypothetical protein